MLRRVNIAKIVTDHFCPYRFGKGRRFSFGFSFLFAVVPLGLGWTLHALIGGIQSDDVALIVTVLSILAAVFTALLPIVHSVIGQSPAADAYDEGARLERDREQIRIESLRESYSAICYAVLLLISGVAVATILAALPSLSSMDDAGSTLSVGERFLRLVKSAASVFIYFVSTSTLLTLLNVIVGVYVALDDQAENITKRLLRRRTD